jgi:hypothetical protein
VLPTWINRESGIHALESTICLLEQQAESSGGLSYQGIFNSHVEFHNGHRIPAVSKASQFLLHVENCTYRDTAGHIHQQQSSPESVALPIGRGRRQKETSVMEEQASMLIDIGERELCSESRDTGMNLTQLH